MGYGLLVGYGLLGGFLAYSHGDEDYKHGHGLLAEHVTFWQGTWPHSDMCYLLSG